LRSLHNRRDWRGGTFQRGIAACKYSLRSVLFRRQQSAWLQYLYGTPAMTEILERDPRLLERPQHAYISRKLPRERRYQIVESHYRHVLAHWPRALTERIYVNGDATLGRLALKDQHEAELRLSVPTGRGREGELALYLLNAQGQALSSLIFTIADEGQTLLIGCLQGAAPELGRDAVRDFTRQAHGLRPKNLLLSVLYALAAKTGVKRILGVSNGAHPFAGQAHKIKANYDGFWLECHGEATQDGFYQLPAREPLRDEARIESKHRSAFRKREALRRQGMDLLVAALTAPRIEFARVA
jgi:uncharacterized protein VirK/YbjX